MLTIGLLLDTSRLMPESWPKTKVRDLLDRSSGDYKAYREKPAVVRCWMVTRSE
jgi:hypothetical protein